MLESEFQYHVLVFRELKIVPRGELETVPPLAGPFSRYKNRFGGFLFQVLVPICVLGVSVFSHLGNFVGFFLCRHQNSINKKTFENKCKKRIS